jgi:hypothetical protein
MANAIVQRDGGPRALRVGALTIEAIRTRRYWIFQYPHPPAALPGQAAVIFAQPDPGFRFASEWGLQQAS